MNGINNRIKSVDALKGMALLGIILLHLGSPVEWAALGVSIFFVSSGFLLERQHELKKLSEKCGIGNNFFFALNHIKKSYWLHIITMVGALALCILKEVPITTKVFLKLFRDVILNIFLLQSWWPSVSVNISLNGVAWFLSSLFFCYYMYNVIHQICINKTINNWVAIIIVLFVQVLISFAALMINPSEDFYRWMTYDCPLFRLGDFSIGCFLWHIFYGAKMDYKRWQFSAYEFLTLFLSIIVVIWDNMACHNTMASRILNNWVTIYIPIACLWMVFLYLNKGIVSSFIVNPILNWIGNNSLELFLIHYVVLMWLKYAFKLLCYDNKMVFALIFVIVTFLGVMISKRIEVHIGKHISNVKIL